MNTHTLKIGITGGIGSGKSTFCKFLESKNYVVINADSLAKELLATNENIKQKIVEAFGPGSYKNGMPDKKYLAEKVFSDSQNVFRINSIIHPVVIERINDEFLKL